MTYDPRILPANLSVPEDDGADDHPATATTVPSFAS